MMIGTITLAAPDSRQWLMPAVAITALTLLWGVLYQGAIVAAIQTWWESPTYSHCFIIIPISAYLVWRKRYDLFCLTPQPYWRALALALPAGGMWFLGMITDINEIQQFAVVALFQVIVLAVLGHKIYRLILFPCLFLFFLVPVGQYLVPPLQTLTTWFVSSGLSLLGIVHYTEGNIIELRNGTFEVAEACAGLRFLIANVVLCTIFAYLAFRKPMKIAVFMIASVVVPIVGNGLRALGIVLIAHWTNNRLAVGADHLVYGWGFSVVILLALFGVGSYFRDTIPVDRQLLYLGESVVPSHLRLLGVVALAALLLVAPPFLLTVRANYFPAREPTLIFPSHRSWTRISAQGPWTPRLSGADQKIHLRVQNDRAPPVDFFLYYYQDDVSHAPTVADEQLWDERHYDLIAAQARNEGWDHEALPLRELVLSSPSEHRLVWWCYWKDGQFYNSGAAIKLLSAADAFRAHTGTTVVAISVPILDNDGGARERLRAALWLMGIFPPHNREDR